MYTALNRALMASGLLDEGERGVQTVAGPQDFRVSSASAADGRDDRGAVVRQVALPHGHADQHHDINFHSGTISEFTRNTNNGNLKLVGTVSAGSKQGPKGMAITPNNSFLYAANF